MLPVNVLPAIPNTPLHTHLFESLRSVLGPAHRDIEHITTCRHRSAATAVWWPLITIYGHVYHGNTRGRSYDKANGDIEGTIWEVLPGGLAESPAEKHIIQNCIKVTDDTHWTHAEHITVFKNVQTIIFFFLSVTLFWIVQEVYWKLCEVTKIHAQNIRG